jgi:hypothetical protein
MSHRDPTILNSPMDTQSYRASQNLGELIDGMMISNISWHALEAVRLFEADLANLAPLAINDWQVSNQIHLILQERERALDLLMQARRIPAVA